MLSIRDTLREITQQLQTSSDSARLDAELLLLHVLKKNRSYLFTYPEKILTTAQQEQLGSLIQQRLQGHPIAHLTGTRDFWTLTLKVTPDTLIPRPETELLIETVLELFPNQNEALNILDLGTGTGAIALALAYEYRNAMITACDVSSTALEIARENAQLNQLPHVNFAQSSWFDAIPNQTFDLIVSNPPYIPVSDPHLSQGDVRFEPLSALASGQDGLDDIRHIVEYAPTYLKANGWLLIEHGYDQGKSVPLLLTEAHFQQVQCKKDLSQNDRITLGQYI